MFAFPRRLTPLVLIIFSALSLPLSTAAATKWEDEYNQGVAAYKARDYARASDLFWQSITDGNGTPSVWLYLAHSKAGEGKLKEARDGYQQVTTIFKDSPEAKAAATYMKGIDSHTWNPGPAAGSGKAGAAAAPAAKGASPAATPAAGQPAAAPAGFRTRVELIPPRDGHPAVSAQTIATVRSAIEGLPPAIYKILDTNNARVFIAANLIDKWPDSLNDPRPGFTDESLADEPSRTYGRDIYIYERPLAGRGDKNLGAARGQTEIKANFLHECGHALDDCLGNFSKDQNLRILYKLDSEGIGDDAREQLAAYLQAGDPGPTEACAEAVGQLLGSSRKDGETFNRVFRRTKPWVKAKLKL